MKIFKYLLMACVACTITSCVQDEDDLFSESAAQRVNTAVEKYTKLLEGAENGWVMNFYPFHDGEMGGVVFTADFADGTVSLLSQDAPDDDPSKSLYQIKGEQEVLLTIDTYNPVLHVYSGPQGSSMPYGYESDYEFAVKGVSADEDTVYLQGKRYQQPLELVRLASGIDKKEYIQDVNRVYKRIARIPRPVAVVNGNDSIEIELTDGILYFAEYVDNPQDYDPDNKDYVEHYVPYVVNPSGFRLQEPVTINGQTFQDCVYDEDTRDVTAVGANVVFPVVLPDGYITYEDYVGKYTFYAYNGRYAIPVEVIADGNDETYTITGLSNYFDVQAVYNPSNGRMEIHAQKVGEYNGLDIWLACWDLLTSGGSLTWSEAAAVDLIRDTEEEGFVLTIKGNRGYDPSFVTDSFILWSLSGGASAGAFNTWTFNGSRSYQLPYLYRMVKVE